MHVIFTNQFSFLRQTFKPRLLFHVFNFFLYLQIQSTLVISNSNGLTETLRDIRTSTYQSWESEENNKLKNHIKQMNM